MPDGQTAPDPQQVLQEFYHICVRARNAFDLYHNLFEADHQGMLRCFYIAPLFFSDVNAILVESIILQWCKITDPAGSGKSTNLTTNYILKKLTWSSSVHDQLLHFNTLLMEFRQKVEPARSKRIAHTDLVAQVDHLPNLGHYNAGEDFEFFTNLQSFFDVAHKDLYPGGPTPPHALGMSTDVHNVVRAFAKAQLYDHCTKCTETDRVSRLLDSEN